MDAGNHGRDKRAAGAATVLGVDQSDRQLAFAAHHLEELPPDRLRYLQHDLRTPLAETGFDVACNIFTSFGYGTEEEDIALFRTLRAAVRTGGRVDESNFDAISGVAQLNWYWSGPAGSGEKHAQWRCYTPTQIVDLLRRASNSNGSPPTDGPADFVALRCWLSNRRRTQSQSAG